MIIQSLAMLGMNDHMLIVIIVALLLFGGKRIPELTRNLGRGIGEFQKGLEEGRYEYSKTVQQTRQASLNNTEAPEEKEKQVS